MRIAAIIGSYHKGNTLAVVKQIEARMKEHGEIEFQYLFLKDANIAECRGCFQCIAKGESCCPLKDDVSKIEQLLLGSDGAIFASPNYAMGVTSGMKRLIERLAYIGHRPRFFGRYMLCVATSGGPAGITQTLDSLSYFSGGGFIPSGKLGLMTPPTQPSEREAKQIVRKINARADALYQAISQKKPLRVRMIDTIPFAAFRGMYRKNPTLGWTEFPADMAYWTEHGWLDKKAVYYCNARIGPIQFLISRLFEKIIGIVAKKMVPKSTPKQLPSQQTV